MLGSSGYPVVLTADRSLTAGYRLLFDGILAASQTTITPYPLFRLLLMPRSASVGVRARLAPLGLRRIEAALRSAGFAQDDVVVADERHLREAIGPATRVIGVSAGEPTGCGMSTTTMRAISGGRPYPSVLFRRLMVTIRNTIHRTGSPARVVVGGPGAWQLAEPSEVRGELGADHVILGYAEGNVAEIFKKMANGEELPELLTGEGVRAQDIPPIVGASTMGVIEISRGCGLGCGFCTIARTPMRHLPEETILADARTNLAAGIRDLCVISEDLFRYGGGGLPVRPQRLIDLLTRLRELDGVRLIQTDHGNISSVWSYTDAQLETVRRLLVGPTGQRYPWVNVGVETASGTLLKANGGGPKMQPYPPDQWPSLCRAQIQRLCHAGFFPMASIVLRLPGEKEGDVRATLDWVRSLGRERVAVFPLLYAPVDGAAPVLRRDLTRLHWRLIRACYRLNFKWIPRMYWDNQRAAGVGATRRCLMQALGWGQAALWRSMFALHTMRSRSDRAD